MQRIILFFLLFSFCVACDRPNPEPEKLDPIYSELEKEISSAESQIKQAEKDLEGFEKDLKSVVPQTGQNKYAEKRVAEAKNKIEKLNQMKLYWEMKLESRKKWDREHYLRAFNKKEPWPDSKEYEEYQIQRKLEQAPKNWDAKQRLEQAKLETAPKTGKSEHGEGGEEKPAPEHH